MKISEIVDNSLHFFKHKITQKFDTSLKKNAKLC